MAQPKMPLRSSNVKKDAAYEEQLAWAAGLFEGEGTITMCGETFTLQLKNTDEAVITRFIDVIDLGYVYGPYIDPSRDGFTRKPFFNWMARNENALEALEILGPWLSDRRLERAAELLGLPFPRVLSLLGVPR